MHDGGETTGERDPRLALGGPFDDRECPVLELQRPLVARQKVIEDGAYSSALKERLAVLEEERAAAKLAAATPHPVLRLHPNLPALYNNKVRQLTAALNEPGTAAQAGEIIRGLIDRIVLIPGNGSLKAELYGNLARLMSFAEPDWGKTKSEAFGGGSHREGAPARERRARKPRRSC